MPGKRGKISPAVLRKLRQARVARFATLDARARPHIVPICFANDGNILYTALDKKPKRVSPERLVRVKNLRAVPHVALLIDEYDEDWTQLWYVLIRGKAKLIPRSAHKERARALGALRAKYPQYARQMLPEDAPIIRISPERTTCWGKIESRGPERRKPSTGTD
ncbi:MAG: TIGR03668 family PPOX class F420-dependent oxidoreductase [Steroidobacteraceae bacterium]